MSNEILPPGWARTTLGELFEFRGGGTPDKNNPAYWNGDIPWASVKDIKGSELRSTVDKTSDEGLRNSASSLAEVDDVIVVTRISPGKAVVSKLRCAINQDLKVIRPPGGMNPRFIQLLFETLCPKIISLSSGTTVLGIRLKELSSIEVSLPPLAEQKRIVAKIEELFSELDAGEESLRVAGLQLVGYRQSLLKQAFEGHLTAQWRTQNSDKLESPDQLLARIQSARQARYEQQLRDWRRDPEANKKPRPPKPNVVIDETSRDGLQQLPSEWSWVTLGEIADTTVGFAFQSKDFQSEGIRLLRGDNIEPRRLRWTNAAHWPESAIDEFRGLLVSEGDIILAMDRPVISSGLKVAMAKAHDVPCLLVQRVARILGSCGIENRFLLALIDQQRFINHCLGNQTGTQLPHISEGQIRAFPVPLCSLPEQQEIVRLLDEQFEEIERNEQVLDGALRKSEALRQAILKKAFTGCLVPQDHTDEPGSVLLARIRSEREVKIQTKVIPMPEKQPVAEPNQKQTLIEILSKEQGWISAQSAFSRKGIGRGSSPAEIEAAYEELRDALGRIEVERRGDDDWLRLKKRRTKP